MYTQTQHLCIVLYTEQKVAISYMAIAFHTYIIYCIKNYTIITYDNIVIV